MEAKSLARSHGHCRKSYEALERHPSCFGGVRMDYSHASRGLNRCVNVAPDGPTIFASVSIPLLSNGASICDVQHKPLIF